MDWALDRARFAELLAALGVAFHREITPPLVRVYFAGLEDLDCDEVERAVLAACKAETFFPTIAALRTHVAPLPGVAAARAARVFERLLARAPHYSPHRGDYWRPVDVETLFGPVAAECFTAAGGTAAFQTRTDRDLPFLRKAFIDAWAAAEKAEAAGTLVAKHAPALPATDPRLAALSAALRDVGQLPAPPRGRERAMPRGDR